ncbi:MAG: electron transport complex subunit RsxC [Sedimenticola sp.]|uniref:Ion-translocating oxidoreductase complex subunit C n=1 Tax=Sedimenticola thiotaurini TaxID=1543721 RepID=A0A558CJH0_9GAMM|nr:electron transport complex subunit RsxC [Sedimenticola sp.]MCW8882187.1 electron transport complex subunit RsxC [Sedimenticola sp.]MCW8950859.1 electron transport complex subunit RsxC [Sedimenticola sp.]TVT48895.1 MAG: electron transport complex subunit RsxC [Sedimenticola thiotaurini]
MSHVNQQKQKHPLHRFNGGLHLPENKALSLTLPLQKAAIPKQLTVPLQQHIGEMAEPLVKVGDQVLKGQMLAKPQGYISAPVHAPSSGTVVAIDLLPIPHPSGLPAPCVVIETDGKDTWGELLEPMPDYMHIDLSLLRERIRNAGIVGLGGAAFPSSVKLTPGLDNPIHTLIINGAECEPYITCDDLLMQTEAERILSGITIIRRLVGAEKCLVGVEDNKPEAISALKQAVAEHQLSWISVITIPTLYPSGGEKQLIKVLTGKEVPSGSIPAKIGMICHNVTTAYAIAQAVIEGKPLISRYVTITGHGVVQPKNLDVLIGTPVAELIQQAGGYTDRVYKLIMGGPMMGFALATDEVPITKASNCLLAADKNESPDPEPALACIRCGQCAAACPANLLPQQMYWYARAKDLEKVQEYNLFDCIECGCCSHVCPSHIPLVQYFRFAKTESWAQEKEQRAAERARQRHEAQLARKARLEAERKARIGQKKEALKKPVTTKASSDGGEDPKKAAIAAALKRAAEKKAALAESGVTPKNQEDLTEGQKRAIKQVNERRAVHEKDTTTSEEQGE